MQDRRKPLKIWTFFTGMTPRPLLWFWNLLVTSLILKCSYPGYFGFIFVHPLNPPPTVTNQWFSQLAMSAHSRTMHPATLQKLLRNGPKAQRAQGLGLASKLPSSQYSCTSTGHPWTSLIREGLTSQNTELKGSATNAPVPETTGKYKRTCAHVLICQSQFRSTIEPPWIRLVQGRLTNVQLLWNLGVWRPGWHLELWGTAIREHRLPWGRVLDQQRCLGRWCMSSHVYMNAITLLWKNIWL